MTLLAAIGICNLLRRLKAAGSLSFFPLVPACKQASGSILDALCLAPVPVPSLIAVHAVNLAKDQKHEVPKSREF